MAVLKIEPQNWLMAAITEGHLVTKAPSCSHHLFLFPFFLFVSPGSTDRESVEFLLWRNAELWHFLKLLEAAQWRQFKEPGAFLSSAPFLKNLPPPLTIILSVWSHGYGRDDDGNVSTGVSWRLLSAKRGNWQVEETLVEPLTLRTRAEY